MSKFIKGKDGKFAGSVGDGKSRVPTASTVHRAPADGTVSTASAAEPDYTQMNAIMQQNLCPSCGSGYGSRYHEVSCGTSAAVAAEPDVSTDPGFLAVREHLSATLSGEGLDAEALEWHRANEGLRNRVEALENEGWDSSDAHAAIVAEDKPIGLAATRALFAGYVPVTELDPDGETAAHAKRAWRTPQPGDHSRRGATHTVVRTADGCVIAVFNDQRCLAIVKTDNREDGVIAFAAAARQITR